MSEEQACLVRARSDSENSSKLGSFGSISHTMTYSEGRLTDMLNPPPDTSGEPSHTPRPNSLPQEANLHNLEGNESGELIDYNDASMLAQFHEDALKQAGCGTVQLRVLVACGLAMAGAALELAVIPFILPSAEIELCIMPHETSWLVLISVVGGCAGAAAWGAAAGALGRRRALLSALAVNAVFSTIAAFMPTYGTFMMARLCSALGSGGIVPTAFSYLAEVCPRARRGAALAGLPLCSGLGGLYACALAGAIVPATGTETLIENKEHFSAWHRYLLLCTLPILASLVSLIWTQESPRYLLEVGREVDAMVVYQSIHSGNQLKVCGRGAGAAGAAGAGAECALGELELPGKRRAPAAPRVRHRLKMFWHAFFQIFSASYRHTTITLGGTLLFATLLQFCISTYTESHVAQLNSERFAQSKRITAGQLFEGVHYNGTMQNIEYANTTFVNCTFADMLMSHVTFTNCSFYSVSFTTIVTANTSFKDCLFVNSSIIDTDIEWSLDVAASARRGTVVRGLRAACRRRRRADLSFRLAGPLRRALHLSLAALLAAPLAPLAYRYRKLFALNMLCVVCSPALYFVTSEYGLYILEAIFRFIITLILYGASVMIVESYPASLRCTAHGLVMAAAWAGAGGVLATGAALWPAAATLLACLLAGLAAALALPARDSAHNLL